MHVVQATVSHSQELESWKSKTPIQLLTGAKFKAQANLRDFFSDLPLVRWIGEKCNNGWISVTFVNISSENLLQNIELDNHD